MIVYQGYVKCLKYHFLMILCDSEKKEERRWVMYQSRQIKKLLSVGDVVYSAQGGMRW